MILATSGSKVSVPGVVSHPPLISIPSQTNSAVSADKTSASLAGTSHSHPASLSSDPTAVRSTPGPSSGALTLATTAPPLPVSAPVSNSALVPPAVTPETETQNARTACDNLPAALVNALTSQNISFNLVVAAAAPGESSAGPSASNPTTATNSNDTSDSQDAPNTASTSKDTQASAPAKRRKPAAKKTQKPKEMCPSK